MSCTILNLKLHLQLLKHWMVLEQPRLKVDASQQYILAKGGQLHHNRTVLYSNHIYVLYFTILQTSLVMIETLEGTIIHTPGSWHQATSTLFHCLDTQGE